MFKTCLLLIHNKQFHSGFREGTMWFGIIGNLVASTWGEDKFPSISKLGVQLPFQAVQEMALGAPMISKVTGAVFHQSDADVIELTGVPQS